VLLRGGTRGLVDTWEVASLHRDDPTLAATRASLLDRYADDEAAELLGTAPASAPSSAHVSAPGTASVPAPTPEAALR
jgi:hypothetical protein